MIFVTGGAGFIGSNFLHYLLRNTDEEIVVIDCLTYAGEIKNIPDSNQVTFSKCNIQDADSVDNIFKKYKPRIVFHFAAESHVDRSVDNCLPFVKTNILGTINLITSALKSDIKKFHHISTDEVYGSLTLQDKNLFTENTNYEPRNPYSASKAGSDHYIISWHHTYGLPYVITNCSNNYGPRQNIEKLIPKIINNALSNKITYMHGGGHQIRDWLHVEDHCNAIWAIEKKGLINDKFNIGGSCEMQNIEVTRKVLDLLEKPHTLIGTTKDRIGQDLRYGINYDKIKKLTGWAPKINFEKGLSDTINWYIKGIK